MKHEDKQPPLDIRGEEEEMEPTSEVGSEGGGEGDVEVGEVQPPASGSEATETRRPVPRQRVEIRRDETGVGRRP